MFSVSKTTCSKQNSVWPKEVCNIAVNWCSYITKYLPSNWPLNALKVILRKQYYLEFQVFEKNSTVMNVCALENVHKWRRQFLMTFDPPTHNVKHIMSNFGGSFWTLQQGEHQQLLPNCYAQFGLAWAGDKNKKKIHLQSCHFHVKCWWWWFLWISHGYPIILIGNLSL